MKWVPKAPAAAPHVDERDNGFQMVVSRKSTGKRPMQVDNVALDVSGANTPTDDTPLCTSNGFEILAEAGCSSNPQGHTTDIALGAYPIPPNE